MSTKEIWHIFVVSREPSASIPYIFSVVFILVLVKLLDKTSTTRCTKKRFDNFSGTVLRKNLAHIKYLQINKTGPSKSYNRSRSLSQTEKLWFIREVFVTNFLRRYCNYMAQDTDTDTVRFSVKQILVHLFAFKFVNTSQTQTAPSLVLKIIWNHSLLRWKTKCFFSCNEWV